MSPSPRGSRALVLLAVAALTGCCLEAVGSPVEETTTGGIGTTGGSSSGGSTTGGGTTGCGGSVCFCPVADVDIQLVVNGESGFTPEQVVVSFSGAASGVMTCASPPGVVDGGAYCRWPEAPAIPGDYTFEISAPGYQTLEVFETLAYTEPPSTCCGCCCASDTLTPGTVTLMREPPDGGF